MHTISRWDNFFFEVADACRRMSKDPSTQCGAVIVRPNRTIAATGWNGFPRGVDDSPERYADRPTKLLMTVHAEANAICSTRESLEGYALYVLPLMPCSNCAALIIQSGIKRVCFKSPAAMPERWQESFSSTMKMFEEAGVELFYVGAA